jgi:hypothetical protein
MTGPFSANRTNYGSGILDNRWIEVNQLFPVPGSKKNPGSSRGLYLLAGLG